MTNLNDYNRSDFFTSNIFDHKILSDEERKMPYKWQGENFMFFCKHADLLGAPVEVRATSTYPFMESSWLAAYQHDLMNFITDWKDNVWKRLNGYSGMSGIKFEFDENISVDFNVNIK